MTWSILRCFPSKNYLWSDLSSRTPSTTRESSTLLSRGCLVGKLIRIWNMECVEKFCVAFNVVPLSAAKRFETSQAGTKISTFDALNLHNFLHINNLLESCAILNTACRSTIQWLDGRSPFKVKSIAAIPLYFWSNTHAHFWHAAEISAKAWIRQAAIVSDLAILNLWKFPMIYSQPLTMKATISTSPLPARSKAS